MIVTPQPPLAFAPDFRRARTCPSLSVHAGRRWSTTDVVPMHLRIVDASFRCAKRPGVDLASDYVADLCLGRMPTGSCLFLEAC